MGFGTARDIAVVRNAEPHPLRQGEVYSDVGREGIARDRGSIDVEGGRTSEAAPCHRKAVTKGVRQPADNCRLAFSEPSEKL